MKRMPPQFPMVRSSILLMALSLSYGCSDASLRGEKRTEIEFKTPAVSRVMKIGPQHDVATKKDFKVTASNIALENSVASHAGFRLDPLPDAEPDLFDREAIIDAEEDTADFFALGEESIKDEAFEEAVVFFRKALGKDRDNAEIWFKLGRTYNQMGQEARGMECLEEAIDYKSDHAGAYSTLVRMMLQRGENVSALSYAKTLRKVEPESFRSAFLLGRAFARQKMWKESVAAFEESLEVKPQDMWANNNLGYSALQIGEYEMAAYALEVATGQEEARSFMFNSLGLAYERLGEPIHAMVAYDAAIEMSPRFVKALVNRERMATALTPEQEEEYAAFQLELPPLDTEVVEEKPVETAAALTAGGGGVAVDNGATAFVDVPEHEGCAH